MWALQPTTTAPARSEWPDSRNLLAVCAAAVAVGSTGLLPQGAAAVIGVAGIHGGLIAAALVWNGASLREAGVPIALLALARMAVAIHPLGAVTYLAVPLWLALLAPPEPLDRAGLARPWPWGPTLVGALAGAALALHLFACASRTLGYGMRLVPSIVLPALAYDLGANVLSAELFFRGAMLPHFWRRWSFGLALAAAAAATAVRYCVDPFVATTELRLGAVVYMTLLSVLNGIFFRWAGSLLPGLAASAVFFAGYRLIGRG